MIDNFKEQYQPDAGNKIASEELISAYKDKVPALLIEI